MVSEWERLDLEKKEAEKKLNSLKRQQRELQRVMSSFPIEKREPLYDTDLVITQRFNEVLKLIEDLRADLAKYPAAAASSSSGAALDENDI
ncbi:hypothetical protein PFISCL1PPCAC_28836, partial [Pristionchus fissidentatus]